MYLLFYKISNPVFKEDKNNNKWWLCHICDTSEQINDIKKKYFNTSQQIMIKQTLSKLSLTSINRIFSDNDILELDLENYINETINSILSEFII